jgi:hypothetical protein
MTKKTETAAEKAKRHAKIEAAVYDNFVSNQTDSLNERHAKIEAAVYDNFVSNLDVAFDHVPRRR